MSIEKIKNGKERDKRGNILFVIASIILLVITMSSIVTLDLVPITTLIMIGVILALCIVVIAILFYKDRIKLGRILSILMCIVMLAISLYSYRTESALVAITGNDTQTDVISFLVREDDSATNLTDTVDDTYSYQKNDDMDMIQAAISYAEDQVGEDLTTQELSNVNEAVKALLDGDADVLIFNESMRSVIEEEFTDFSSETRVLDFYEYVTSAVENDEEEDAFNMEPFTVYISGNDDYGTLTESGRSDVNIIATINPTTKQILLVSTPRDYWVLVDSTMGATGYEKLTHAGNYGVKSSIATLENLYGIQIDYYVKLNFDGVVQVVDALGGITINSEVDFTNGEDASDTQYHFTVGENECDGSKTLAFCRERHVFTDGDNQRGRNQMQALRAIITKLTSPSILLNYDSILSAIENVVATNIPQDYITGLIKLQLQDGSDWNVTTYSVTGTSATRTGELFGIEGMSVQIPDQDTVDEAVQMINEVYGETD